MAKKLLALALSVSLILGLASVGFAEGVTPPVASPDHTIMVNIHPEEIGGRLSDFLTFSNNIVPDESGQIVLKKGEEVTITALNKEGYKLREWKEGNLVLLEKPSITLTYGGTSPNKGESVYTLGGHYEKMENSNHAITTVLANEGQLTVSDAAGSAVTQAAPGTTLKLYFKNFSEYENYFVKDVLEDGTSKGIIIGHTNKPIDYVMPDKDVVLQPVFVANSGTIDISGGKLGYEINDTSSGSKPVVINGGEASGTFTIPSKIFDVFDVEHISLNSGNFTGATEITVEPGSKTITIGGQAFQTCTGLKTLNLPKNIKFEGGIFGDPASFTGGPVTVNFSGTKNDWKGLTLRGFPDYGENVVVMCSDGKYQNQPMSENIARVFLQPDTDVAEKFTELFTLDNKLIRIPAMSLEYIVDIGSAASLNVSITAKDIPGFTFTEWKYIASGGSETSEPKVITTTNKTLSIDMYANYDYSIHPVYNSTPTADPTPTPTPTPAPGGDNDTPSGGGSSGGSSGGGGSSGSSSSGSSSSNRTERTETENKSVVSGGIKTDKDEKGNTVIKQEEFKKVAEKASNANERTVNADTMKGNVVEARLYIDASVASNLAQPISTAVDIDPKARENTYSKATFEKFFDNKVETVTFAHKGSLGMLIPAAVKLDISKFTAKTLYMYSYDIAKNTYILVNIVPKTIDANGYFHFSTNYGDTLIFTDRALKLR